MKNSEILTNSIAECQLAPHLRNKISNSSTNYNSTNISAIKFKSGIAGESINVGQLIYQGNDLKFYLAGIKTHAAEFVATTSGIANATFDYGDDEDFIIDTPATAYDDLLVLGLNGAFKIAGTVEDGDIYQVVGQAKGGSLIHIKIEEGYPVDIVS